MLWSMGTKKWVFKSSGRLDETMVPILCIHTNTLNWTQNLRAYAMLIDDLLNEAC